MWDEDVPAVSPLPLFFEHPPLTLTDHVPLGERDHHPAAARARRLALWARERRQRAVLAPSVDRRHPRRQREERGGERVRVAPRAAGEQARAARGAAGAAAGGRGAGGSARREGGGGAAGVLPAHAAWRARSAPGGGGRAHADAHGAHGDLGPLLDARARRARRPLLPQPLRRLGAGALAPGAAAAAAAAAGGRRAALRGRGAARDRAARRGQRHPGACPWRHLSVVGRAGGSLLTLLVVL
eukprot:scaffold36934_cov61-Phaeocystis_antarctica.AAC.6